VLAHYGSIERIPEAARDWDVSVRGAPALAATLVARREEAMLFKDLATLRVDRSLPGSIEGLRWLGPTPEFAAVCERIDAQAVARRADAVAAARC
jgi:hypothetical protein